MEQTITNFLRETRELTIRIPALPRPTLPQIQSKYIRVRSIERDNSPEGPVTLKLATALRIDEKGKITGTEYEHRLAPSQDVALGYQHLRWLLKHQTNYPAFMVLLGKVYIDFPGIVVEFGEDGDRVVPFCLHNVNVGWSETWRYLDRSVNSDSRVAVASK